MVEGGGISYTQSNQEFAKAIILSVAIKIGPTTYVWNNPFVMFNTALKKQ